MIDPEEPNRGATIGALLKPLWSDVNEAEHFPKDQPLLAHYTSMANVEAILRSKEVWFSSPFYMNDFEEVRFGIENAATIVESHAGLSDVLASHENRTLFIRAYRHWHAQFTLRHAEELYLFCLSKHQPEDYDGRLSMWRGYGGNGTGAALVFDTKGINVTSESPLLIGCVHYASTDQRRAWISQKVDSLIEILKQTQLSTPDMAFVAYFLFERIKAFALFTKHCGFIEEQEWRVVYMPDRDRLQKLQKYQTFSIGVAGIQPKLRIPLGHIEGLTENGISLSTMIDRILLGPNVASPLAKIATMRMVTALGFPELAARVQSSTIPYR